MVIRYKQKKLFFRFAFCIVYLVISFSFAFSANQEFQRPPCPCDPQILDCSQEPYHLALTDPQAYRIKLYKAFLVRDDNTEVTLYENPGGIIIDLVNGQFTPVSDVDIPPGHYKFIKIITDRTYGLKGYCYYEDANPGGKKGYWYTKRSGSQSDIGFSTDIPTNKADDGMHVITIEDPGSGTENYEYKGFLTHLYTYPIDLNIDYGQRPRIRAEFLADNYLELNDRYEPSKTAVHLLRLLLALL